MKAKMINEVQNFERGLDPKKAMDIGLYWKKDIKDFIDGLKKIGIKAKAESSDSWPGVYDFILENLFDEEDEENINGYQVSYVTKKAAEKYTEEEGDGWEPGFIVSGEDGELLLEATMNVNQVIKFFAKRLFGLSLKSRIIVKQKELNKLKEIQEYLDSITLPYLR